MVETSRTKTMPLDVVGEGLDKPSFGCFSLISDV